MLLRKVILISAPQTVDISDLARVISSLSYGGGSGNPFVKFDYDTRMMFCYAKGDHRYTYCEVGMLH